MDDEDEKSKNSLITYAHYSTSVGVLEFMTTRSVNVHFMIYHLLDLQYRSMELPLIQGDTE